MNSGVHPKYKTKYRVSNWAEYDRALVQRGDITLWFSPDAADSWAVGSQNPSAGQSPRDARIEEHVVVHRSRNPNRPSRQQRQTSKPTRIAPEQPSLWFGIERPQPPRPPNFAGFSGSIPGSRREVSTPCAWVALGGVAGQRVSAGDVFFGRWHERLTERSKIKRTTMERKKEYLAQNAA